MKKFFIPFLLLAALMNTFVSCKKSSSSTATINVQGLFSLTGNWSSLGLNSQAALSVAVSDINAYLAGKNASFRMAAAVSDTKLDTGLAKSFFTQAKDNKVSFIIGPQSSAELAAIKPLSDASDIIVISQGSTAGSLSIAGDNIFRFCPPDKIEGAAMGETIYKKGIKGLVTVARDDAGNKGLQTTTGASFTAKGGVVAALTPYSTTLTDYTTVIASIKTQLNTLIGTYGADKVGVYLASFDEGVQLFKQAASDPVLTSVKWFGGDGVALSAAFTSDATAAEFVIKTSFFAPSFGLPTANQSSWQPIAARIKAITNTDPDAFALAVYDAMWVIAYTVEANNSSTSDFAKLKTAFVQQADAHSGIVGSDGLDDNGDRANGTFDYFSITKQNGGYTWVFVGNSAD